MWLAKKLAPYISPKFHTRHENGHRKMPVFFVLWRWDILSSPNTSPPKRRGRPPKVKEAPVPTPPPQGEMVVPIPLTELHPFPNHPFKVRDDEVGPTMPCLPVSPSPVFPVPQPLLYYKSRSFTVRKILIKSQQKNKESTAKSWYNTAGLVPKL